jgi:uncharacterized protein YjdB
LRVQSRWRRVRPRCISDLNPLEGPSTPGLDGSLLDGPSDAAIDRAADGALRDAGAGDGAAFLDAPSDAPSIRLLSIDVTPPLFTIVRGTKQALVATGVFSDGSTANLTGQAAWQSSAPGVASVAGGTVTAVAPGTATITATVGAISGSARATVPTATIVAIAVAPARAQVPVTATVTFAAVATLSDGTAQDVTSSATWLSPNPAIATVAAGIATGAGPGSTTISARIGAISGTAQLTVTSARLVAIAITPTNPIAGAGVTIPFVATGSYSDGSVTDVTATATWASSSPNVSLAKNVATTMAPGTSIVTATVGGVVGQTTVTVTSAPLTSIAVTPASNVLAVGATAQLSATGTYADGTKTNLTQSVTWTAAPPSVAGVSNAAGSQGLVTGLSAGQSTITAVLGGVSGKAQVTVTSASLVSIAIAPANPTTPTGTQVQLRALGAYSDGSMVDLTAQVTWSTANPAIATVSNASPSQGSIAALGAGSTVVTATLGGVTGTTTLTVTAGTLVSIAVTPANSTIVLGGRQAMKATGTYSDGSSVDLTTQVVWSTGVPGVAAISNASGSQGLLTGVSGGVSSVSAAFGGVSGTTSIMVSVPAVSQLVVSPIDTSLPAGQNLQFTATAIFANGTSQNVTALATWASSNTAAATVNATGRATTVAIGTTTISAAWNGMTGSTTLTVTSGVVTQVQVTPIDPSYNTGEVAQFQATAIYADGTSLGVTAQATWQSSAPGVAGVAPRGLVTAIAAGQAVISATFQGHTGSTTVTVDAATIVSISVFPGVASKAVGQAQQFTATAIYSNGTSQGVTGLSTWQSNNASAVGVSDAVGSKGLATAIAAGSATITANYGGATGGAKFTVTGATLVSIQVTPTQPTRPVGPPVQFLATAIYSDNPSANVTGQATWQSSDATVAAVSDAIGSKGLAQTLAAGSASITATYQGVTGATTITVTAATLSQIQVTPFNPTMPAGFGRQLQATGIYSDNSTRNLTLLATWTSSAPSVATVSDSGGTKGALSPLSAGNTTVSATYGGVTGTDSVTVSSATVSVHRRQAACIDACSESQRAAHRDGHVHGRLDVEPDGIRDVAIERGIRVRRQQRGWEPRARRRAVERHGDDYGGPRQRAGNGDCHGSVSLRR